MVDPLFLKIPPAARILALAMARIGRPAFEWEIVAECAKMRREGLHDFDLGSSNNLRNRLQRNWAGSKIYQTKWAKTYAAIFVRIPGVAGGKARWTLVKGFKPK